MKKVFSIIVLVFIILMSIITPVKADSRANRLRLKVTNANEPYDIYILLPKQYIVYAINHDNLSIKYEGANTLINNFIPSIPIDINNVQEDTYVDEGIEYVQIKLDNIGEDEYYFEIISEYTNMDMMYRITSKTRDNLMVIDNFELKNNICEMEYNYEANTIKSKSANNIEIRYNLQWWQIILLIIVIGIVIYYYYYKNKQQN